VTTTISPLTRPDSAEHFTTSPSGLPEEDSVTPPGETNDAETNTADGLDTSAFPAAAESAVTGAVTPEPASSAPEVTALDENPESFHELIMQFNADCWVEVKDANGERLAYGVIKANEVRTLNGEMPFSVTLGNAGAAQIKLDGRTVDESVYLSNTRGGVARFVLEPPAPG
jgi:cytoskeleton protein RodZ